MSAYAPYTSSYLNRVPYLTTTEYLNAPTSLDTAHLIEGGTAAQNLTALAEVIGRASSWIDIYCCGVMGSLCATLNTENGFVSVDRRGWVNIHPQFWPILEVVSASVGAGPMAMYPVQNSGIIVEQQVFRVTYGGQATQAGAPLSFAGFGWQPGSRVYCVYTYVNGWFNQVTSASVAAGATSVTVPSTVGVYPGDVFTWYDAPSDEQSVVASSFVLGSTTIPFVTPTVYSHASGVSLTSLPPAVKQAAIFLTSTLIKSRGDSAFKIDSLGAMTKKEEGGVDDSGDMEIAVELLDPFRSVFMGGGPI